MTRTPVEALARADRIQIALLAGLLALAAVILGAGVLAYTALSGQILAVQQSMHEEIFGLPTEMSAEQAEMRGEIRSLRDETQTVSERVARIETMIEIHHGPLPGL